MSRKATVNDFANEREYEAHKRQLRKDSRNRRQSSTGRRGFEFQPVAPAMGTEE
ncbi:hypothetical protein uav_018 [Pseudomonas phage UAVern]|uniref:Uncharacterized protein n=1 Tax=Pseudomonas phage UAVern TaxID=2856997 RepID=A0A975UUD8_9CAUD|nr:hypothetical protein uav_018 [Pseudomonas phage UAVern]